MKNQKGVTLIALVVTIIVLLILAGVSIAMLNGSNGVFSKTVQASEDTEKAQIKENVELAMSACYQSEISNNPTAGTWKIELKDVVNEIKATNNITDSTTITSKTDESRK